MAFLDDLQYRTENLSLYFQGGVRRSVLIFGGVAIVLLAPAFFAGQLTSNIWKNFWFDESNIVIPKNIQVQDYTVSDTEVVPLATGQNELYISVNNKANTGSGYNPWIYSLQILDQNDRLLSQQRFQSYLLPEETKYLVARSNDNQGVKLKLIQEPQTQLVQYNPNANQLYKNPNFEIRSSSITSLDDKNLEIRALFKNNDQVTVQRVDVLFIVRDTRQAVVGIGTYSFNGFAAGSEREIKFSYPKPANREARFLDLRYSVNFLDQDNIRFG